MKSVNWIVNGVLLVAVVILYVLHFSQPKTSGTSVEEQVTMPMHSIQDSNGNVKICKIAHVNTDTILANYKYYQKKKKDLEIRTNNADYQYSQKVKDLENHYQTLVTKIKMGLTTEEEAQMEFEKKQKELEYLRSDLQQKLLKEEQDLTMQLYDSIIAQVYRFNKTAKYNYILGYQAGGGILYSDESYDLTRQILDGLNNELEENQDK